MFPLKSILFLLVFSTGCLGSIFYHPMIGILTYVLDYNIAPAHHWWGIPLTSMGFQWSKIAAISIIIGMIVHHNKISFKKGLSLQEVLMVLLVLVIWGSQFWGLPSGPLTSSNAVKMTKVAVFIFILTHVVTTKKRFELFLWSLILIGTYLGIAAYTAPSWAFRSGRLNIGVGGPDFMEGNFLGAHFGMILPFIGIFFLRGNIKVKLLCLFSSVFVINAIILTRSRGVLLGCVIGILIAVIMAIGYMKGKRIKIISWILVGIIGAFLLTDPGFWRRMSTLENTTRGIDRVDTSAMGRIWAWEASWDMFKKHPMGIGEGNFRNYVGFFDDRIPGKDAHSTYLRCLAELGIFGTLILAMMILNGFLILKKVWRIATSKGLSDYQWYVYATLIALVIFLVCGAFITETYIEEFYWLLFFPVILNRAIENETSLGETK